MKLVLSQKDIEAILLEHTKSKFPVQFNTVEFDCAYSSLKSVTLSFEETEIKNEQPNA